MVRETRYVKTDVRFGLSVKNWSRKVWSQVSGELIDGWSLPRGGSQNFHIPTFDVESNASGPRSIRAFVTALQPFCRFFDVFGVFEYLVSYRHSCSNVDTQGVIRRRIPRRIERCKAFCHRTLFVSTRGEKRFLHVKNTCNFAISAISESTSKLKMVSSDSAPPKT